jgi:hypothetical protein
MTTWPMLTAHVVLCATSAQLRLVSRLHTNIAGLSHHNSTPATTCSPWISPFSSLIPCHTHPHPPQPQPHPADIEDSSQWAEWDVCVSMFDSHVSSSFEANLEYMFKNYGFYLPDAQYLKDPEGLVKWVTAEGLGVLLVLRLMMAALGL